MDLEAELLKSMPEEELEGQVADRIKSFHGFLTREVALRLIAKEKGLLRQEDKEYRLADIPKGEKRVSFTAVVRKVWPVATYSSGKRSRVVEVEDESGRKPLVLWNDDVDLAGPLRLKDRIAVSGAYEKSGEIHLGYSGRLEVTEKAGYMPLEDLKEGERAHVRGFVTAIEGADGFIRDGRLTPGFSFMISDGRSERRCVVFEGSDRAGRLRKGDELIMEGAHVSNGNLELDKDSRILSRRASEMLLGSVDGIECRGESLFVSVDGKSYSMDRVNGLRFLGVEAADDIALSTVVSLKKDSVLNKRIALKIEHKDGRIVVRC
jgi:hypothetical protein